jgi:hypothetical protein
MFKKIFNNIYVLKEQLKTPEQRNQLFRRLISSKYLLSYIIVSNILGCAFFLPKFNKSNYEASYTRYLSRKIGKIMEISIPEFLRKTIYGIYIKVFNVDKTELEEPNLKSYLNIQEFFTRKINVYYYLF